MRQNSVLLDGIGQPTRSAVIRYTEGDCWLLAYEIGVLLDLPIVALVSAQDRTDWRHLTVDLGRERLLDVLGVRSREETMQFWSVRARSALEFREVGRHQTLDSLLGALDDMPLGLHVTERDQADARCVARALANRFEYAVSV